MGGVWGWSEQEALPALSDLCSLRTPFPSPSYSSLEHLLLLT